MKPGKPETVFFQFELAQGMQKELSGEGVTRWKKRLGMLLQRNELAEGKDATNEGQRHLERVFRNRKYLKLNEIGNLKTEAGMIVPMNRQVVSRSLKRLVRKRENFLDLRDARGRPQNCGYTAQSPRRLDGNTCGLDKS